MVMTSDFTEDDLSEMVLRLAHEIRNPLATIKSAVQLLEHIQRPEGEIAEFYDSIHTEVARIDRVVRDMQCYVRLDTHTATRITVAEAVASVVEAVRSERGLPGSCVQVIEGPASSILVDRVQLETALRELVDNAIRFSPEQAHVTVSWRSNDHGVVSIDVDDSGCGVADAVKHRIFRPFFSTSTQGTGLGLNIVARVAELAGGELEFCALDAGGTRFTVTLPRV